MLKFHSTAILEIPHESQVSLPQLKRKLRSKKGVKNVSLDPVHSRVTVEFNPSKIALDEIRAILTDNKETHEERFMTHFRRGV